MNMIGSFNKTIEYIETVLEGEIDEKKIVSLSGYSLPMFRRIFSILTGQTLTEYIRYRKLTESAIELRETECKVIDIAFKYGYESPDAFGTAFKMYHGFTPTEVRNGKPFKMFSRVQLALSIKGGRSMNITIQKKSGFTMAGINVNDMETTLCPSV